MKVYMLLDASGSMQTNWDEMLGAINGYVAGLAKDVKISLTAFDSHAEMNFNKIRDNYAGDWVNITSKEVQPVGNTPLIDASVYTLTDMLGSGEERAVFVLITDGDENSSKIFEKKHVDALIKLADKKKYEVLFIGANFDKVGQVAQSYNLQPNKYADVKPSLFRSAMTDFSASTMAYASTGAEMSAPQNYSNTVFTGHVAGLAKDVA